MTRQVQEFDSAKEDWPQYVEQLGQFFIANDITGAKKQAVFLVAMGPTTFKVLQSLIAPAKPEEKSYEDLVKALTEYFKPTLSDTVQRFKFHGRIRQLDESVAAYVVELRSIAEHCNFGASLQAMLRDQLVCGINNKAVQRQLLSESPFTFEKALSLAQGLETAAQNVKELQGGPVATSRREVHKVTPQPAFRAEEGQMGSKAGRPQPAIVVANHVMGLISASSKVLCVSNVARKVTSGQFATASPSPLVLPTRCNRSKSLKTLKGMSTLYFI